MWIPIAKCYSRKCHDRVKCLHLILQYLCRHVCCSDDASTMSFVAVNGMTLPNRYKLKGHLNRIKYKLSLVLAHFWKFYVYLKIVQKHLTSKYKLLSSSLIQQHFISHTCLTISCWDDPPSIPQGVQQYVLQLMLIRNCSQNSKVSFGKLH